MLQCIQPDITQCTHTQYTWLSAHDRVHMTEGTYILRRFCLPWARWPVDTLIWLHLFCSFGDAKNYVHYNSLTKMFNWRWTCIFFELGCKVPYGGPCGLCWWEIILGIQIKICIVLVIPPHQIPLRFFLSFPLVIKRGLRLVWDQDVYLVSSVLASRMGRSGKAADLIACRSLSASDMPRSLILWW